MHFIIKLINILLKYAKYIKFFVHVGEINLLKLRIVLKVLDKNYE
jgi:hypothetical protein